MSKVRVIIEVADGCAYVYADQPDKLDVVVVDHDIEGLEPEELHLLAGDMGKELVSLEFGNCERGPDFEALWQSIQNAEPCTEGSA